MKKHFTLVAVIMMEIGLFFLLQHFHLLPYPQMNSWPFFLIMFGIAFFIHSKVDGDGESIVPAILLTGLGSHFLWGKNYPFWPDDLTAILLILGLAFTVRSFMAKRGAVQGFMLLLIGGVLYFLPSISLFFVQKRVPNWESLWPILFLIVGFYLFVKRK